MDEQHLSDIRARLEAATPGPWFVHQHKGYTEDEVRTKHPDYQTPPHGWHIADVGYAAGHPRQNFDRDAAFIAHAPTDIAALLAEVERLRRDCAEAYQIVGCLADMAGKFDTPSVQRALDNLAAVADGEPRPHDDLLPWPDDTKEPLEAK